jgi:hypothetical protein
MLAQQYFVLFAFQLDISSELKVQKACCHAAAMQSVSSHAILLNSVNAALAFRAGQFLSQYGSR